jgi:hypothetical protein
MILAVKYLVAGREIWDNNSGKNYYATFSKSNLRVEHPISSSEEESAQVVADLRSRLEQVVKNGEDENFFSTPIPRYLDGGSVRESTPSLRASRSLGERYDIGESLRNPVWKPRSAHLRTITHPSNSIPWHSNSPTPVIKVTHSVTPLFRRPPAILGSPREFDSENVQPLAHTDRNPEELPFSIPSHSRGIRNNQRGYFDSPLPDASFVNMTPLSGRGDDDVRSTTQPSEWVPVSQPGTGIGTDNSSGPPAANAMRFSGHSTPIISVSSHPSPSSSSSEPSKNRGSVIESSLSPSSYRDDYRQLLNRCVQKFVFRLPFLFTCTGFVSTPGRTHLACKRKFLVRILHLASKSCSRPHHRHLVRFLESPSLQRRISMQLCN